MEYIIDLFRRMSYASVWLRKDCRTTFTSGQAPFTTLQSPHDNRLFEDCSDRVNCNHGAPLLVYCPSGNRLPYGLLRDGDNFSADRFAHPFTALLRSRGTCRIVLSRRSAVLQRWRRRVASLLAPRKAATYQLMAPSQSAVSFPHR